MKEARDSDWETAFKTAGKWVGIAGALAVPTALLLPDPWSKSPIPMILWLVVGAVPLLLPVVSGCYYRSVKVAFAAAIVTCTIGCAVLVLLLVVNLGAGFGTYF